MTNSFTPRDWQDRFVREYQTNAVKNFLLEACTSAGKTAGAIYSYVFLKDGAECTGLRLFRILNPKYAQSWLAFFSSGCSFRTS